MAIDSKAKRASAMNFVGHRKGRLIPDGTIASPDLQDAVGFYRGILAGAVADIDLFFFINFYADNRQALFNSDNRQASLNSDNRQVKLYHD